jgi:hypothetical protein
VKRSLGSRYLLGVLIGVPLATVLLLIVLAALFPDALIVLAWHYSDRIPLPFSWVQQAIFAFAVVSWVVLLVLVGWFQLRR